MRRAGDHTRPRGGPRACGTLCTWWACFVDYGGADARGFDAPGLLSDTGETVTDALPDQVAIFDMAGGLVDGEPHHHAAWHRLCLEEGVALTLSEVAERTLGRPVRESLPTLLGRALDPDEHERLV